MIYILMRSNNQGQYLSSSLQEYIFFSNMGSMLLQDKRLLLRITVIPVRTGLQRREVK